MAQADWPGTSGLPAVASRAGYALKSLQLPFATGNGETDAPEILWGSGSPEGAVMGVPGDPYIQVSGPDQARIWLKSSGTGNTGWSVAAAHGANSAIAYADLFAGADAGIKIAAALATLPASGGIVDVTGLTGAQTISSDFFAGVTTEKPILLVFGPTTFTVTTAVTAIFVPSYVTLRLMGTVFNAQDGTTMTRLFETRHGSGLLSATNGSQTVTIGTGPTNNSQVAVGKCLAIFGHLPNHGGTDSTTLNGGIGTSDTTIVVTSAAWAGTVGSNQYFRIDNELIQGVVGTNQFTACARGYGGTTAASHTNGATVQRVVYDNYEITAVSGSTVTLHKNFAGTTAPTIDYQIGVVDVVFDGVGTLDGKKGATDSGTNLQVLYVIYARRVQTARTIRIQNGDHGGVTLVQSRDCTIDGQIVGNGRPDAVLGAGVWAFGGVHNCTILGDYDGNSTSIQCDDRSTSPQLFDNGTDSLTVAPRSIRRIYQRGVACEGTNDSAFALPKLEGDTTYLTPTPFFFNSTQWVVNPTINRNTVLIGDVSPTGNVLGSGTGVNGGTGNFLICQTAGVDFTSPLPVGNYAILGPNASGFATLAGLTKFLGAGVWLGSGPATVNLDPTTAGHTGLYVNANILSSLANASYGVVGDIVHPATSTAEASGFWVKVRTVAAAFSVANLYGIHVNDAVQGAGSTITTQHGIKIDDQTKGATNFAIKTGLGLVQLGDQVQSTKRIYSAQVGLGSGTSFTPDASAANSFKGTATGNLTWNAPTSPVTGQRIVLTTVQDGTGGWTVTFNAVFKVSWSDTGNTANKRSSIAAIYDGTNWNQDGAQTPYV